MGVREIDRSLEQWQMGVKDLRRRMILAPTPRERERWYAILLLAQGLTAAATAEALERDPHTIGRWASAALGQDLGNLRARPSPPGAAAATGPAGPDIRQTGGCPWTRRRSSTGGGPPAAAGIQLANWYWRVVRQFVSERFGISRCRSSCLNWLYRLGFACKRPKKRLLKANESKREAFVAEYAALWEEAQRTEASIFFADEAHFRADAELRGKWVLQRGQAKEVNRQKLTPTCVWWTPIARGMGRRPATIQRCAWRRARWNGWNWRATATAGPRLPS